LVICAAAASTEKFIRGCERVIAEEDYLVLDVGFPTSHVQRKK
jgi:hypothetical protein